MHARSLRSALVILSLVLVASLTIGCGSPSSSTSGSDTPAIAATVHISDGKFDPQEIAVEIGGSVMWINDDVASHALQFMPPKKLYSSNIKPGGVWMHTFTSAGTYDYYCAFHNTMKGSVVVRSAP